MYNKSKRVKLFALALLILAVSMIVSLNKAKAATAYNNTTNAMLNCSINSGGTLQAAMSVFGVSGVTSRIDVELYIEKRILGVFWKKINIGYPNNIWTDSTTGIVYSHIFTTDLTSTGTYRVSVTYTVSGSGGSANVIPFTQKLSY